MKKVIIAAVAILGFTAASFAQTPAEKPAKKAKTEKAATDTAKAHKSHKAAAKKAA
jgi:hypothetical protein